MDGHGENNNRKIDVEKLTKEAEAGHGHYIRSILDSLLRSKFVLPMK
jgi:hypothetical protein